MTILRAYRNANDKPIVAAGLLRDLAKWAIEQAEIIEDLEGTKKTLDREPFFDTNVVMCSIAEDTRGYNKATKRVRKYIGMED